jgi:hypothetical protein
VPPPRPPPPSRETSGASPELEPAAGLLPALCSAELEPAAGGAKASSDSSSDTEEENVAEEVLHRPAAPRLYQLAALCQSTGLWWDSFEDELGLGEGGEDA